MSNRDAQIINAASALFMRYGIGRTTMADIAQEAGVARQTLYNAYPNKDEVLRAVARCSAQSTTDAVHAAWATAPRLEAKIDIYFDLVPLAWFDMVAAAPDAAELIDGVNTIAKSEMEEAMNHWRTAFRDLFAQTGAADAADIADFFVSSSKTAKIDVIDKQTLNRRLETLKRATLALLPASA